MLLAFPLFFGYSICMAVHIGLIAFIGDAQMTQDELADKILKQTTQVDGLKKLSCHRAHVLAEDLAVSVKAIGSVCQEQGIKIVNCQLGCFGDKTDA
jgi:hypothetical protein